VKERVVFAENGSVYDYKDVNQNEIETCMKKSKEKCGASNICKFTKKTCSLVLPKKNLVTETDNEAYYYGRMADELIRYNRIKSFVFKPQSYLSFGNVKYNLRDDELIVLQDLITQEFFEGLVPSDINSYAKYNTYDTAVPIISQMYDNNVKIEDIEQSKEIEITSVCVPSEPAPTNMMRWKQCFPQKYFEISYPGNDDTCCFYLIIDIVKYCLGRTVKMDDIKIDLINEYKKITDDFKDKEVIGKIMDILEEENQNINDLKEGVVNLKGMILNKSFTFANAKLEQCSSVSF
jgi:hypothetical protein